MTHYIDSSDLRLQPGEWPNVVVHEGQPYLRGSATVDRDNDVVAVDYYAIVGPIAADPFDSLTSLSLRMVVAND